jgi:hypothetical protein
MTKAQGLNLALVCLTVRACCLAATIRTLHLDFVLALTKADECNVLKHGALPRFAEPTHGMLSIDVPRPQFDKDTLWRSG